MKADGCIANDAENEKYLLTVGFIGLICYLCRRQKTVYRVNVTVEPNTIKCGQKKRSNCLRFFISMIYVSIRFSFLHRKHHCESDLRGFVAVDDFVGLASDLFPAVGVKQSAIFGIDL